MVKHRIKPSDRKKKRYMAFEVKSKDKIDSISSISSEIRKIMGAFTGAHAFGIKVLEDKWNPRLQRGLVKVDNALAAHLRASLPSIKKIGNQSVSMRSIGASGILKKAEKRYLAK